MGRGVCTAGRARAAGRGGHGAASCKVSCSCAAQAPDPAAPSPPARLPRRKKAEMERARARGGAARGRCGRDGAGRGGRQPELRGGGPQPRAPSPRRARAARYLPAEQLSSASSAGGRIPAAEAARPSRSRAARTPCAPDPSRAPLLLPGAAPARAAPSGGRERERPSVRSQQRRMEVVLPPNWTAPSSSSSGVLTSGPPFCLPSPSPAEEHSLPLLCPK